MKLTLFICISLLASLLHAAAMPVEGLGGSPMIHGVGEIKQNSHAHHASMKHGADHGEVEDYCPDNQYSCCLIVVLKPDSIDPDTGFSREEFFASRSLNQPIFRPESLYRPPKFYSALAG